MNRMKKYLLLLGFACLAPVAIADYLQIIPDFWRHLYPNGGKSLYCGDKFAAFDRRYNIEHVFPMAWVAKHLNCGSRKQCRRNSARFRKIEADMHNLYPARREVNDARGSMAYALLPGEKFAYSACDIEIDQRKRRVEPRPAVRGDIARAMLYMEERYGLPLYKHQRKLLLAWHEQDPAEKFERWRNQRIKDLQGNGNPWISKP
jgi:deoxyribonuclease-1